MLRNSKSDQKNEVLLKLRDAALQLGISFPTIKQWIYKKRFAVSRPPEDTTVSRKVNWIGCFSEREGERRGAQGGHAPRQRQEPVNWANR